MSRDRLVGLVVKASVARVADLGSIPACRVIPVKYNLQWAIYYTVKQHLETVLYKPLCHPGFKVSCAVYCVSDGALLLTLSLPL